MSHARHPAARLLALALVLLLSYFAWLPFPWRQPGVALIATALVVLAREPLASLGFRWPLPLASTILWALAAVAISVALITPVVEPLLNRLTGTMADYSSYGALRGNVRVALRLVAFAWLSAALGEEIIFRGFFIHQAAALFGGGRAAEAASVPLGAVLFGLAHLPQGLVGVILTGLTGLLMGIVFVASRRNIWSIVLAHGLIDTWGVYTLYRGWY